MSRLGICTTTHECMHTHKKRGEWWLNKHLQRLMGVWVMEKGSKWVKEWRHKRDRSKWEWEVWERGCQEQIVVAAYWSATRKIRGEIKRNMRGSGAARVRKRWKQQQNGCEMWNETSRRKKASWELSDELSGAIMKKNEDDRGELTKEDNQ